MKADKDEEGMDVKEKVTMGFSVNNAPIWLCKKLSQEAEQYYANAYWPVIVDWYRKAKEFENMVRGGMPGPDIVAEPQMIEEKDERPTVNLFGGHKGESR